MSTSNKKLISELIDLGSGVRGHQVNGSDNTEIKKNLSQIITASRARKKAEPVG
jgi:hypothetical protein